MLTVSDSAAAARPEFCWATPLSATPVRTASSSPSERKSHERRRISYLLFVRDHHGGVCECVERARLTRVRAAEETAPIAINGAARDRPLVDRERGDGKKMHAVRSCVQLRAVGILAARNDEVPSVACAAVLVELFAALPKENKDDQALPERCVRTWHHLVGERKRHTPAVDDRTPHDVGQTRDCSARNLDPVPHVRVVARRSWVRFWIAQRTRSKRRRRFLPCGQARAPSAVQ